MSRLNYNIVSSSDKKPFWCFNLKTCTNDNNNPVHTKIHASKMLFIINDTIPATTAKNV